VSGVDQRDEPERTTEEVSKSSKDGVKIGGSTLFRDEPGGKLVTAQVAPGIQVA
jgi:hypothetical protein